MSEVIKGYYNALSGFANPAITEFYGWLEREGRDYDPSVPFELAKKHRLLVHNAVPRGCFQNARAAANRLVADGAEYVEGFYVTRDVGMPFEHAWVVVDGVVFDSTALMMGFDILEYHGVVVPRRFLTGRQHTYATPLQRYYRECVDAARRENASPPEKGLAVSTG